MPETIFFLIFFTKTVKSLSSKSKIMCFRVPLLPILAYNYLGLPFFCVFGYVSGKLKRLSWFQRCLIGNYIFQDELPAILMKFLSITLSKLRFVYFSSSLRNKRHDFALVIQINFRFTSMSSIVRQNYTHFLNSDYDQQNKRAIP